MRNINIFLVPLCTHVIVRSLPRRDLKSLRLVSKNLNEIVLDQSHLFERAYLSCAEKDLEVLQEISKKDYIRRRVKELVWDVTIEPGYSDYADNPSLEGPRDRTVEIIRIMNQYFDNRRHGRDFRLLLTALPELPRLKHVVFVELMRDWTASSDAYKGDGQYHVRHRHPNADRITYQSPAMREWVDFEFGHINAPGSYHNLTPSVEALAAIEAWAQGFVTKSVPNHFPWHYMSPFRTKAYREICLLAVALHVLKRTLESFTVEAAPRPSWYFHGGRDPPWFLGIDLADINYFQPCWTRLSNACHSLRRLCLCIDNRVSRSDPDNWRTFLNPLLSSAQHLECLELEMLFREDLTGLILPNRSRLHTLVLDNFTMSMERLSSFVHRSSFPIELDTLCLTDCLIMVPYPRTRFQFFTGLLALDSSLDKMDDRITTEDDSSFEHIRFLDVDLPSDDDSDSDFVPEKEVSVYDRWPPKLFAVALDPTDIVKKKPAMYKEGYRLHLQINNCVVMTRRPPYVADLELWYI